MTAATVTLHLLLGLAVGLLLALAHAWATRRATLAALDKASAVRLLLGFPLRVGLAGAGLFGLAWVSLWALAGGVLAFLVGQRVALARLELPGGGPEPLAESAANR